jgi:hypothetical protein
VGAPLGEVVGLSLVTMASVLSVTTALVLETPGSG